MKGLEKYNTRVALNWFNHLCPVKVYSSFLTLQDGVQKGDSFEYLATY